MLRSRLRMSAPDRTQSLVRHAGATIASPFDSVVDAAARHERLLWGVVVAALFADVALTAVGLGQGLTEGNPAMRWAIGAGGIGALALAKLCTLAVGVTVRLWRPVYAGVVPLGLAIPWLVAASVNASLLL